MLGSLYSAGDCGDVILGSHVVNVRAYTCFAFLQNVISHFTHVFEVDTVFYNLDGHIPVSCLVLFFPTARIRAPAPVA